MDIDLVKAIFAVYVVGGSLIRILDDNELFRLTAIKNLGTQSGFAAPFFIKYCYVVVSCYDLFLPWNSVSDNLLTHSFVPFS